LFRIQHAARIDLRLGNGPGATGELRRAIDRLAEWCGLGPEGRFDLKLAATEALTNAVKKTEDDHVVDVTLEGYDGVIDVEVADRGPFAAPAAAGGLAEGGRGIPIMLALVDEVEFSHTGEGTRVRMRKRLGPRV
jgi:anti-sigma regulatory factor (Ser/Thr protein kinase)